MRQPVCGAIHNAAVCQVLYGRACVCVYARPVIHLDNGRHVDKEAVETAHVLIVGFPVAGRIDYIERRQSVDRVENDGLTAGLHERGADF